MKRSAGLFDMACMRRNRGTKTLLVLATVCIVLITIHIPQFLKLLADIDSPIDELDDGVHFGRSQTSESTQRRHSQERMLAVNDWDHRQPERPSVSTDNDALSSQSKSSRDPKVCKLSICSPKDGGLVFRDMHQCSFALPLSKTGVSADCETIYCERGNGSTKEYRREARIFRN